MGKQLKKDQVSHNSGIEKMPQTDTADEVSWLNLLYLLPLLLPLADKVKDLFHDVMEHGYKMQFSCGTVKLSFEAPEQTDNNTAEQE